jgi:hypothetical protein
MRHIVLLAALGSVCCALAGCNGYQSECRGIEGLLADPQLRTQLLRGATRQLAAGEFQRSRAVRGATNLPGSYSVTVAPEFQRLSDNSAPSWVKLDERVIFGPQFNPIAVFVGYENMRGTVIALNPNGSGWADKNFGDGIGTLCAETR